MAHLEGLLNGMLVLLAAAVWEVLVLWERREELLKQQGAKE